ncbi:Fe-S oxidoreductase [Pirellula sp. SH-Sr6A]|uniref:Fe-S oxidoreductase n=1 Tax=Pirellula sp. SH-Sr6A TaxID=1632865 RepID=UPI0011BA5DA4|nr:Fe-S oxidoreductase [Pirellula sp. SH-Sr6A]
MTAFPREYMMSVDTLLSTRSLRARLAKFMSRPQRHRLLHGYPLAAAMRFAGEDERQRAAHCDPKFVLSRNPSHPMLVGVLPHPFCNPKISGCGFCTFPHEAFSSAKAAAVSAAVEHEVEQRVPPSSSFYQASVDALYFGGGTANLTPADSFRRLSHCLVQAFDLTKAEVSLEGVPRNFVLGKPLLLDVMTEEIPARHFRISMGIQTFSETQLEKMGRLGFGRPETFASAVDAAHVRGMTASGDLLCNLPGQTLEEMKSDVRKAIDIGLDQICLYHLVMFPGLGTAWSRDSSLTSALPSNPEAEHNWCSLRETLLQNGFHQTSLTNFEYKQFENDARRYRYEPISYESSHCQVMGFGPSGISFAASEDGHYALKTMNPESSLQYMQSVRSPSPIWNRYYSYDRSDWEVLQVTRRLASLRLDAHTVSMLQASDRWDRFSERLELLREKELIHGDRTGYELTPKGMFYSDSIAALMTEIRWDGRDELARNDVHTSNSGGHM